MATLGNCIGDNYVVPGANPCLGVTQVIAGTNVTVTGTQYQPVINATGGGGGGGVTSLAYTTGINGSATTGAITLSNTGVTSITGSSGIGVSGTGAITLTNLFPTITLYSGSNISVTNTSTINVAINPMFSNSMGFTNPTGNNQFQNAQYPFGTPDYYPYMFSGSGANVNNTLGAKQFWATNTPGSSTGSVLKYAYNGINAQQGSTGTTIPFMAFNNGTGTFDLTNIATITGLNLVNSLTAGTNISLSATTGNITIDATSAGVNSLSLASGGGLYNIGTATDPILGALVVDVYSAGTGIGVTSSSGNYGISNTGVTSIVAGTGISVSGATGAVTIDATGGSASPSQTAIFTPVINGLWTAIDGDVALLNRPLSFSVISNLATAETIVVHFSCGPILGQSTAGPTNASYFSIKALVSPSGLGTPVATPAYGQYVVQYGDTMGGDFIVVLSKARGEFFADSSLIQLYKMDLPAAPFSSAIIPFIAVPNIYVNMYSM